jgi:2-oxoglutarate ferredoxin oxidoreductase subunit alpha
MEPIVNDFSISIATVNGTGSQSANLILLQTLFDMGVPVSGKNLFPSNISGLPTWYILRVSNQGYQAPGDRVHIQVMMNKDTWEKDLDNCLPGTVIIYNTDVKMPAPEKEGCIIYGAAMTKMARSINPKLARMIANMAYVGVLADLLGLDQAILESAVAKQFNGKEKAISINVQAINMAREWSAENIEKQDPYTIEAAEKDLDAFFTNGNEAIALGSIYGGITMLPWYPITPSTGIAEGVATWSPRLRQDKDGKATCAIIQSEDELAAVGMVVGAGWAGGRAMTCTSGPGISLMSEFIGLAYFAEVPGVIWDVNRTGPSTGLPTRTQQGDLSMLYEASHGDTKFPVLIPGNMEECFEFAWRAFDYAEQLQTIVFGFSDLDLGMNQWSCKDFKYPDQPMNRGKILRTQEELDAVENYGRYRDVDGDGIPYRTLPGSGLAPYLTRGTGRDEDGNYSEDPKVYHKNMQRLKKKINGARTILPQPLQRLEKEREVGIVYYGSMETTIQEIDDQLEATGLMVSQCRVRALPLSPEVEKFIAEHDTTIILEINRDGQLYGIVRKEIPIELVPKVHSVAYSDGLPPRARIYSDLILETLRGCGYDN